MIEMKKVKFLSFCVASAVLVGCGGDDVPEEEVVTEAVIQQDLADNLDESSLPDLDAAMEQSLAGGADAPAPTPGEAAPPPSSDGDAVSTMDSEGNVVRTPLQMMQQAVDFYHDPAERGIEDMIANMLANMEFQTEQAMDMAQQKLEAKYMNIPPLQDLEGLVKARVLAKIPDPPAGKQWKYDPATKKVSLE